MIEQNQNSHGLPTLLTGSELAELLRVKTATIRRWRKIGKGPDFIVIGCRPMYPTVSIEKWLSNRLRIGEQ